MDKITSFCGEHAWLSNFWLCAIEFDGHTYPSVEHAYVAAKTEDKELRKVFQGAKTAGQVKRLGRKMVLRDDWASIRLTVMRDLLLYKFKHHPDLRKRLLATGIAHLEEGNTWGDRYWGTCNGIGQNKMGILLMEIRSVLRTNSLF